MLGLLKKIRGVFKSSSFLFLGSSRYFSGLRCHDPEKSLVLIKKNCVRVRSIGLFTFEFRRVIGFDKDEKRGISRIFGSR